MKVKRRGGEGEGQASEGSWSASTSEMLPSRQGATTTLTVRSTPPKLVPLRTRASEEATTAESRSRLHFVMKSKAREKYTRRIVSARAQEERATEKQARLTSLRAMNDLPELLLLGLADGEDTSPGSGSGEGAGSARSISARARRGGWPKKLTQEVPIADPRSDSCRRVPTKRSQGRTALSERNESAVTIDESERAETNERR